jgi:hypothetical protein
MAADAAPNSERFQTFVTILIALLSTAIALVASQAAVVIGNTTEALHNGVLAKINQERVDGGSRVQVARNLQAFDDYRYRSSLSTVTRTYAADAEAAKNTAYGTRLRLEAAALREESDLSYNSMDTYYLTSDDQGNYTGFDVTRFIADERQSAEVGQHLDLRFEDNFTEAAGLQNQALTLSISIIVLFFSVMFMTWAQITKSFLRWVWLAAGLLIALAVGAGFVLAWLGVLDWLNKLVFG